MSEWYLIALLVSLTCLCAFLLLYPLRRHVVFSVLFMPVIWIFVFCGYFAFGGFGQWQQYTQQQARHAAAQQMLQSIKSPQELIDKLRAKLDDTPQSAQGWYLLGKLYLNQKDFRSASQSFGKAHKLKPANENYSVHYAHSLWSLNNQKMNPQIKSLFAVLLKNNPKQPDALAMLAMDAFDHHDNALAIRYWQRLLKLVPVQSEEAAAIREAIARAKILKT